MERIEVFGQFVQNPLKARGPHLRAWYLPKMIDSTSTQKTPLRQCHFQNYELSNRIAMNTFCWVRSRADNSVLTNTRSYEHKRQVIACLRLHKNKIRRRFLENSLIAPGSISCTFVRVVKIIVNKYVISTAENIKK